MADDDLGAPDSVALQRRVAMLLLERLGTMGFALAGSGAIREHGITDRPTNDIDLFALSDIGPDLFARAVETGEDALRDQGFRVTRTRSTPEFARLLVEVSDIGAERAVEVDFGIDWRKDPPAQLSIGPVLALTDAVGSKIGAVYSRGEVRDYLDLDSIRRSRRFADQELISLAHEHDPGFEMTMFIERVRAVVQFGAVEVAEYGIDPAALQQIKDRLTAWADHLASPEQKRPGPPPPSRRAAPPARPGPDRDLGGPSIGF